MSPQHQEKQTTTKSKLTRRLFLQGSATAVVGSTVAQASRTADAVEHVDRNALKTGKLVRDACRSGQLDGQTSGLAPGFAQANLVILPRKLAYDFLLFCRRNPKPCPLLDVTEPGKTVPSVVAPNADLRTDLPRYRVWRNGELIAEPTDIRNLWQDDFVSFVIGCSFTFEQLYCEPVCPYDT